RDPARPRQQRAAGRAGSGDRFPGGPKVTAPGPLLYVLRTARWAQSRVVGWSRGERATAGVTASAAARRAPRRVARVEAPADSRLLGRQLGLVLGNSSHPGRRLRPL